MYLNCNKLESNYLKINNISKKDWDILLLLITNNYLILSTNYSKFNLTYKQYQNLINKLKLADVIKTIKGTIRLNPYLYLKSSCSIGLATILQQEYSGTVRKLLPDYIDSTGEVFCYSKYTHNKYRPKKISDFY